MNQHILRKTIEGSLNLFLLYNIWEYDFQTNYFVIDRSITMQFTKMQIEIHGSLVTIQYYTKFTSKKFSALYFLLKPLPGHCLCSNSDHRRKLTPIYQSFPLIMGQILKKNTLIWHPPANLTTNLQ